MRKFLVSARVLHGYKALGVNAFFMLLRISPFIIVCEKIENLNNNRYLKERIFNGLSIACYSSQ